MRVAYLDNAATTPLAPEVAEVMLEVMRNEPGNPSSLHGLGRRARAIVEDARAVVAGLLCAQPDEIVFTSSGTEANNTVLKGIALQHEGEPAHLISSAIEHPCVLECCKSLREQGVEVTLIGVNREGLIDPAEIAAAIRPDTRLISIMAANNVVGTLQPIREIAALAREKGVLFHTDAVQAAGKIPLDVHEYGIDLMSLSAHKLHGPKGVGALYVRKGVSLKPLLHGGGQEHGMRSGTENVAGVAGFGRAAALVRERGSAAVVRMVQQRERILEQVQREIPEAYLIGDRHRRLPGHLCFGFAGREGEAISLLLALDAEGVAVSSGSACSAHKAHEPSYVLRAMGFDAFRARGALRVSLGFLTSDREIESLLAALPRAVANLHCVDTRAGRDSGEKFQRSMSL